MSLSSSIFQYYGFSTSIAEGLEIVYSYNTVDPIVDYIDQSYEYEDPSNDDDLKPFPYGFKAAFTQQILNNMPPWMAMRKDYNSTGNKLTNAWGMQLEDAIRTYNIYRKDQFLATANTYYNINAFVSPISNDKNRIYESKLNNLLFNSSFSILSCAREQRPLGWRTSRNSINGISFNSTESLYGNHCLVLDGSISSSQLKQTRQVSVNGGSLTLSLFVKTEDTGLSSTALWETDEAGIILVIENIDSTISTYGVGFPKNTSNKWSRVSLTATLLKETYKVTCIILNRTSNKFYVHCPMLEQSDTMNQWTASINDTNPFYNNSIRLIAGVQVLFESQDGEKVKRIEIQPVSSEQQFKNIFVPTRIVPYSISTTPGNSFSNTHGRHINFFEEIMPTNWIIRSNQIVEGSISSPDKFGTRLLADATIDQNGDLYLDASLINNESIEAKALCIHEDNMFVVTKETYMGSSYYYLKFAKPQYITHEDEYIPSFGDLRIPINLGSSFGYGSINEDVVRIGICKNISNVIYIDTNLDRRFYFKLIYDYYYPDFNTRKLFCREDYSQSLGQLQII